MPIVRTHFPPIFPIPGYIIRAISLFHGLKNRGKNVPWGDVFTFMADITKYCKSSLVHCFVCVFIMWKSHYHKWQISLASQKMKVPNYRAMFNFDILWRRNRKRKKKGRTKKMADNCGHAVACGWWLSGGFLWYFRTFYAQNVINLQQYIIYFSI